MTDDEKDIVVYIENKDIANKYRKIQQINSSIYQQIDELINIKIAL